MASPLGYHPAPSLQNSRKRFLLQGEGLVPWADFHQKSRWWKKGQCQHCLQEVSMGTRLLNGVSCLCQVGTQFSRHCLLYLIWKYPTKVPRHPKQCLFSKVGEVTSSKINPLVFSMYQLIAVNWSRDRLVLRFESEALNVGPKPDGEPVTWLMSGTLQRLKDFIRAGRTQTCWQTINKGVMRQRQLTGVSWPLPAKSLAHHAAWKDCI